MPKQQINRSVVLLNASNQRGVFAAKASEKIEGKPATKPKGIQFNQSDPRSIDTARDNVDINYMLSQ